MITARGSSGTASSSYLQIPVLFKGHLPTGTMLTPNVAAGPDFNLKLSAPDGTQTFLMAIDFGAGVDLDVLPSAPLSFDFRYCLGLTDLIDGFDSKVHEIEFLFGVKFKL